MQRFLLNRVGMAATSVALICFLSGCSHSDKQAKHAPATKIAPIKKVAAPTYPIIYVVNAGNATIMQTTSDENYTLSIPLSAISQVISLDPKTQQHLQYTTDDSVKTLFPATSNFNQQSMDAVLSSDTLLPRFVTVSKESVLNNNLTYQLTSSLPFHQATLRDMTITFNKSTD